MKDPLNMRCDVVLVLSAIDGLEKYLTVTEAQMEEVWHIERHTLGTRSSPPNRRDDEQDSSALNNLDNLYETELYPAMRYSFVVLLHIFAETQLRKFCSALRDERHIPIGVSDLNGSAIEKTHTFLTKLAGVDVLGLSKTEWDNLINIQKIRNCIVHAYGRVKDLKKADEKKWLRQFVSKRKDISIGDDGRLQIEASFCQQQLENLRSLFERLFEAADWA